MSSLQFPSSSKKNPLSSPRDDFDYGELDKETQIFLKECTSKIKEYLRNSAQAIWEIGQKLVDVRNRLTYGQFTSWLLTEFQWSRSTAYNYIKVFERFGDCPDFEKINIAVSALYLLSAPSTPKQACQKALNSALLGEVITYSKAKAIVRQYKQLEKEDENQQFEKNILPSDRDRESVSVKVNLTQLSIGDRVVHPAWGTGTIVKLEGDAGEVTKILQWRGKYINQDFPLVMWNERNKLWPVRTEELLIPVVNVLQNQINSSILDDSRSDKITCNDLRVRNLSDLELKLLLEEVEKEINKREKGSLSKTNANTILEINTKFVF